jgi:hypothetical protein
MTAQYYALLPIDTEGHPERRPPAYPILVSRSANELADETGLAHLVPNGCTGDFARYNVKVDHCLVGHPMQTKSLNISVSLRGEISLEECSKDFRLELITEKEANEVTKRAKALAD